MRRREGGGGFAERMEERGGGGGGKGKWSMAGNGGGEADLFLGVRDNFGKGECAFRKY